MIRITGIVISHSKNCRKDLKIKGDRKIEAFKTEIEFSSEKEVREYWNQYAKVLGIPKMKIDFHTVDFNGKGCILK